MRKADARSIRTKEAIRTALEEMIVEGRRENITVTALAERAGIHRKTFYLHYDSIETLLDAFAMSVIEDIIREYRNNANEGGDSKRIGGQSLRIDFKEMNAAFFRTVSANPPLHKRLFCDPDYRFLHDRINSLGTGLFSKMIESDSPHSAEMNIVLSIMSSGILAAWDAWYRIGAVSEERLSEIIETTMGDAADLFVSLQG